MSARADYLRSILAEVEDTADEVEPELEVTEAEPEADERRLVFNRVEVRYDYKTGTWPPHPEAPAIFIGGTSANPPTAWDHNDLWWAYD